MTKLLPPALATLVALSGAQALANTPTITLGGYADFQVGFSDQDNQYDDQGVDSRSTHTRIDSNVNLKIDAKADNGLGYGAYVDVLSDVSSSGDDAAYTPDARNERAYLYIESGFGRVEGGATGDAANALRVDASTFARGTGGIGGDWYHYADLDNNNAASTINNVFYVLPGLPGAVMPEEVIADDQTAEERAYANKISLYSSRVQGVQVGVSFTPDQKEKGSQNGFADRYDNTQNAINSPSFENVWDLGINYENEFQGFIVETSATGEIGTAKDISSVANATNDDLQAYALGLSVSHSGVTVGGSWAEAPEFGRLSTNDSSAKYWTVGAAYENGPIGTSVGYLNSIIKNENGTADTELSNVTFGADYQLAPGLVPYVELSLFNTDDNNSATNDNQGSVLLIGTELNF